jgi:MGT family glycosyltransferase
MAKFVYVVPPYDGHVNPTLSVGNELLKRGNEVAWISVDQRLEANLPPGGKFLFIHHDYNEQSIKEYLKEQLKAFSQGFPDLMTMYESLLLPLNQYMLDGIINHLAEYRPDVVIYDHQLFAGSVAAARLNIPFAASVTTPITVKANDLLPKVYEWEKEQVIGFQQRNGIAGDKRLDEYAKLVLIYTSELFFGNNEVPAFYKFIGPVIKDRPTPYDFDWKRFESMRNRPCLLVSLGTMFENEVMRPFYQKVIEALHDENVSVIMVSDPELFTTVPENFIIQKRVPQLKLLPYLQLVICPAGYNTTAETLFHGIPLIVLPVASDQSRIANMVIQLGAGIRLKFNRFKPEELKNAVHEILNNSTYKFNAQKVQASFKEAGGTERAASLLENLVNG